MKNLLIGLSALAIVGGGAYWYLHSAKYKRSWLLKKAPESSSKINAMSDDEIKVSYKLVHATMNKVDPGLTPSEMTQLNLISAKYNIFT
jgi:uncharacterized protein YxeA